MELKLVCIYWKIDLFDEPPTVLHHVALLVVKELIDRETSAGRNNIIILHLFQVSTI